MTGPTLPAPLVSTQWLADYLGSDDLLVLDASVIPYPQPNGRPGYISGDEQYLVNGHIPGAVFADLIEAFSQKDAPLPFTHLSADDFAIAAGGVGVDADTTVVIYDSAIGQWASRLWWLFRAAGFDRVAVLDGGLTKWTAEGRPLDVGHVEPVARVFEAVERPELWVTKAEVAAIAAGEAPGALVCGVPPKEFSGEEGARARLGHIPGSINVPAGRLVDRETNALLDEDGLRASFAPVLSAERIVVYCAAGIAAASDALALTVLGNRNVALYDGSLREWAADESLPLVVTAT